MAHSAVSALGCSGSLLLTLAVTYPATAVPNPQNSVEAEQGHPITVITQQDDLGDRIGCGCAVCQGMPIETDL